MKLLQILYSGPGGQASVAFSLQEADHEGHFKHQFLFYGIAELWPAYERCCVDRQLDYRVVTKKAGVDLPSWKKVRQALHELKPDAIILHSTNLIFPVYRYCRKQGIKLIVVEHTSMDVKRKIEHVFSRWSVRLASQMVYLTIDSRKSNAEAYKSSKIMNSPIIANGIDHQIYRRKREAAPEPIKISMIARFSTQKNQAMLVRAMKFLPEMQLTLAGHGETWDDVAELVKTSGVEERVNLPGMLNQQALVDLLNDTNIYVHCSFGETLPTAVLQAMSCALPILGSDIPGLNDLIEVGENGFLFSNESDEKLAELIRELAANAEQRKRFAAKSRELITSYYTKEVMFEKYRKLVQES